MARPKLYQPNQSWPVWLALWVYEFCASLKLAVVLILSLAGVLAWATFVESHLGSSGARYYVYQSDGFLVLLALLGLNVFCAAAIRFPWQRHQTGFVITHLGLLVLLAGSAFSFRYSLNSQLLVYQSGSSRVAVDLDAAGSFQFHGLPGRSQPLILPFRPGPFSWSDLEPYGLSRRVATLLGRDNSSQPWQHPPVLLYHDPETDTRVEWVDYYARSEVRLLPYVGLKFKQSAMAMEMPIDLEFDEKLRFSQENFGGIGRVLFWRTDDAGWFEGFTQCVPERTVDGDGAVAIWYRDELFHLPVSQLQARQRTGEPTPLTDDLSVELVQYAPTADMSRLVSERRVVTVDSEPRMPAVELKLTQRGDPKAQDEAEKPKTFTLIRFAEFPFIPQRDAPPGLVADFFHPAMPGRVDVVEGPRQQLAYRVWQQKTGRVVATGPLQPGTPVETWSMGGGKAVWQTTLDRYLPREDEEQTFAVLPLPFDKEDRGATRRAKVRVSWKDPSAPNGRATDEFWLRQNSPAPWQRAGTEQIHRTATAHGEITSRLEVRQTDVGFDMRLDEFDLRVDPGSSMAGNYTSFVTITDVRHNPELQKLQAERDRATSVAERERLDRELAEATRKVTEKLRQAADEKLPKGQRDGQLSLPEGTVSRHVVTMNAPLDYPDPQGRTLRFFQENYLPPRDDEPLGSVFRVNYDPGRWIKYLGSDLIVLGIFLMFYMRAYFITGKKAPAVPAAKEAQRPLQPAQPVATG